MTHIEELQKLADMEAFSIDYARSAMRSSAAELLRLEKALAVRDLVIAYWKARCGDVTADETCDRAVKELERLERLERPADQLSEL